MFVITSETLIQADAESVYHLITDLENYAVWNPWVIEAHGQPAVGGALIPVTVKLGAKTMQVKHKILEMQPGRRFVWCDTGWFTAVACGQRARTLKPVGDAVHYRVELSVRGPLAWLARRLHGNALKAGLQAETAALKKLAEAKNK